VGARVKDPHLVEDLVQESLARVMAARERIEPGKLPHYASVTARNLVASMAAGNDRARARTHLLVEDKGDESPVAEVIVQEERSTVTAALAKLPAEERDLLVAHEVQGRSTATIAAGRGTTPGAVAARLYRARANLRVEYLLVAERIDPPTDRCRPVLRAMSNANRRRQDELDASGHLLECEACARLTSLLFERRDAQEVEGLVRVSVTRDADVVEARQQSRAVAAEIGFTATDLTLIATAVSEITRNIVKFAERGEVTFTAMSAHPQGIQVVARDVGPGIANPQEAMRDGYSTYHGFGLGLPGARRLMDRFELVSVPGRGTTVTMEKWLS
jgi:serine/threonine-protein kinase RsbT